MLDGATHIGHPGHVVAIVVVGSVNVDFVWRGTRLPSVGETVGDGALVRVFGGKGANQAAALARLDASVAFVGAVGDDDLGAAARADLESLGIDCTALAVAREQATGTALVLVDDAGNNQIAVAPGANAHVPHRAVTQALDRGTNAVDVVVTGFEVGVRRAADALRAARDRNIATVCNPSPVSKSAAAWRAIESSDVVIVNDVEADAYGGADALRARGARTVVVTHGSAGATRYTGDGIDTCAGFTVDVVDTTGAGDGFCAAYALRHDLEFACAVGALVCGALGARTAQPTADEAERFVTASRQPRR